MKKSKKFKNKIEISMTAPEMLELLNFFSYIRDDKEAWCPAVGKLNQQLYELVISRIEGREAKAFIKTTDDFVQEFDRKKLQKLAFTPHPVDAAAFAAKQHNAATAEEIIQTMEAPVVENDPSPGQIQSEQMRAKKRALAVDFIRSGKAKTPEDIVRVIKDASRGVRGLEWTDNISEEKYSEVIKEAVKEVLK